MGSMRGGRNSLAENVALWDRLDSDNDSVTAHTDGYNYKYQAAAAANVVVKASPGYLHGVILGAWVTGGVLEISDHESDGDGNVQVKLTAGATDESGFPKFVPVDCYFATGITADIASLTDITFIYR